MSADNWAICPRCRRREVARVNELRLRAAESYGTVPVDEFDALRAEAEKPIDEAALVTFREDYETGLYDDDDKAEFFVHYTGHCDVCKLAHKFTISQPIAGVDD